MFERMCFSCEEWERSVVIERQREKEGKGKRKWREKKKRKGKNEICVASLLPFFFSLAGLLLWNDAFVLLRGRLKNNQTQTAQDAKANECE